MKELLAKVSLLTGARLAGVGFAFVTSLIITQAFGTEGLARYATAFAAASIMAVTMLAGFHAFAPIVTARYRAQTTYGRLRGFVRVGWLLIGIGSGLCLGVMALAIGVFFRVLGPWWLQTLVFASATAPAIALSLFHGGVLSGLQRQVAAQVPDSFFRPLFVLIFVGAFWALASSARFEWVLAIVSLMVWLLALIQFRLTMLALADHPSDQADEDWGTWRSMAPSWMAIALIWDYGIDLFLLIAAYLASAEEVALLYVCFRYRNLAGFGIRSIYIVLQPKIYTAVTQGDRAQVERLIAMTNGTSLSYALVALAGLWVLGPFLLGVFDPAFADATGVLILVALSFVARAVLGPGLALLSIHNQQARIALVLVGSLILSISVGVALSPVFGLVAIAGAYTGFTVMTSGVLWLFARQLTGHDSSSWSSLGYGIRFLAGERQGVART
ncbi:MAG: hypothetical protein AAGH43_10980 [Pseudomonadota bacterium]